MAIEVETVWTMKAISLLIIIQVNPWIGPNSVAISNAIEKYICMIFRHTHSSFAYIKRQSIQETDKICIRLECEGKTPTNRSKAG